MNRSELEPHRIVRLEGDAVVLLDQGRLPDAEVELRCATACRARRGHPGVRGSRRARDRDRGRVRDGPRGGARRGSRPRLETLAASRPTAVNLRWALEAMRDDPTRERAERPRRRGRAVRRMGAHAVELFPAARGCSRTATRAASRRAATAPRSARSGPPRRRGVSSTSGWRDATAPPGEPPDRLGARAARHRAHGDRRRRSRVVHGARRRRPRRDRRRPDRRERRRRNKIGTYALAVLAAHHGLPLVVVAPTSTLDPSRPTGAEIPIEDRDPAEVTTRFPARNPAFDVTPGHLVDRDRDRARCPPGPVRRDLAAGSRGRPMIGHALDDETNALLERFGFDGPRFEVLRARVASGCAVGRGQCGRRPRSSRPPRRRPRDVCRRRGSAPAGRRRRTAGLEALAAGRVGPGRARRWDGDAVRRRRERGRRGARRAQLPLVEARRDGATSGRALDVEIPVALMTSFAHRRGERAPTSSSLAVPEPLWFSQRHLAQADRGRGELFDEEGRASALRAGPRRPARGDSKLGDAPSLSPARGVGTLAVSNVDDLGARLDPVVVGTHVSSGRAMTSEVARKEGDLGGAPARVERSTSASSKGRSSRADFDEERSGLQHEHRDPRPSTRSIGRSTCAGSTCASRSQGATRFSSSTCTTTPSWELPTGLPRGAAYRLSRQVLPDQGAAWTSSARAAPPGRVLGAWVLD